MKRHRPPLVSDFGFAVAAFILFSILAALPLEAAGPSSRDLNSDWQFRAAGDLVGLTSADQTGINQPGINQADVKQWHPAEVPGVVQTDLLRNKLIPDPFDRDNEFRLQWIGLSDWEYQTVFQADAAALAHDHIDMVFDGLD